MKKKKDVLKAATLIAIIVLTGCTKEEDSNLTTKPAIEETTSKETTKEETTSKETTKGILEDIPKDIENGAKSAIDKAQRAVTDIVDGAKDAAEEIVNPASDTFDPTMIWPFVSTASLSMGLAFYLSKENKDKK